MFDCNLIKSREQKMREILLPSLESTYQKMHVHDPGATPRPNPLMPPNFTSPAAPSRPQAPIAPSIPQAPAAPSAPAHPASPAMPSAPGAPAASPSPAVPFMPMFPRTQPESELDFPANPLLPKILPSSPNIKVPLNPLLPPGYSSVMDYEGLQYLNGYLRTQINRDVQVEFLVGSTNIIKREGRLVGVGLNYILLEDMKTGDITACDFYNIKFCRSLTDGNSTAAE